MKVEEMEDEGVKGAAEGEALGDCERKGLAIDQITEIIVGILCVKVVCFITMCLSNGSSVFQVWSQIS